MENLKEFVKKLGISYLISIILFLIVAIIFAYTSISDNLLNIFVYGVNIVSVIIGSMLLLKKIKKKGLVYGLIFGLIYFLLLYIISVIFYTGFFMNSGVLIYMLTTCIGGIIGGIIGVNIL